MNSFWDRFWNTFWNSSYNWLTAIPVCLGITIRVCFIIKGLNEIREHEAGLLPQ